MSQKTYAVDKVALEYTERAKRAQEMRRQAPLVDVKGNTTIPQKDLIKKYAKEYDGQDAEDGYHFMFGDRKKSNSYPDLGYEPVIDQGQQVQWEGDPMWKIPTDFYLAELEAVRIRSGRMTQESIKADEAKAAKSPVSTGEKTTIIEGDPAEVMHKLQEVVAKDG